MKTLCLTCRKELSIKPSRIKKGGGKFCSLKCRGAYQTLNGSGKNSKSWKNKIKRKYPNCGKDSEIHKPLVKKTNCCSKKCQAENYSEINIGDGNPNWRGEISPYTHLIRTSKEMNLRRQKVFIRDNFTCCKCKDNKGGNLNAHHIKEFIVLIKESKEYMPLLNTYDAAMMYSPLWDINNGMTLCRTCHIKEYIRI